MPRTEKCWGSGLHRLQKRRVYTNDMDKDGGGRKMSGMVGSEPSADLLFTQTTLFSNLGFSKHSIRVELFLSLRPGGGIWGHDSKKD
jgi:hypothetical protein